MQIHYCDGCGKRIGGQADAPSEPPPGPVYCPECQARLAPPQTKTSGTIPGPKPTARRISETVRPPSGPSGRPHAPAARSDASAPTNMTLIYLGAGAAVLVGALILWSMGSGPKSAQTSKVEAKKAEPASSPPPAHPAPDSTPPANPTVAPAQNPQAKTEPAEEKTHELSPKELFEQRQREAKSAAPAGDAKTPEPAKTDAPKAEEPKPAGNLLARPSPPADDASWKPLFNGQDLTGFAIGKGKWVAEDGMLKTVPSSSTASRLDFKAPFADYEFTCQLYSDDSEYTHIQFRETLGFPISRHSNGKWVAFRAVAVGGSVDASVDGTPLPTKTSADADPRSTAIRIYVSEKWTVKIKDLRVREIKP